MHKEDAALRGRIAQGWLAMFLCLQGMIFMALVRDAVHNDFSRWALDPGNIGLHILSTLMVIYIAMPMLVRGAQSRWFRWLAMGMAAFVGLFMLAHQVAHTLNNTRPFDVVQVFDFAHHAMALWVVSLTLRWAREAPFDDVPVHALNPAR